MVDIPTVRWRGSVHITAVLAGLALVAGACSGSTRDDAADPRSLTEDSTPATTTTIGTGDPFAVPTTIDAAYLDRVLVELNRVYGDVVRQIRTTRQLRRTDLLPLSAIFSGPLLEQQLQLFGDIPGRDPALYKDPIGDRKIAVQELLTAQPDCIFARAIFDVSAVAANPPPAHAKFIKLELKAAAADPRGVNPTPWVMALETDKVEPACVGS